MLDLAAVVIGAGVTSTAANTTDTTILWVGCALMFIGVLCFGYLRLRKATATSRGFYDKTIMIVTVATCAYLAMALGIASIHPQGIATPDDLTHRVFIPRYVDWAITTPLLLLDIILFSKPLLNKGWQWDAFVVCAFDIVMVVTGAVAGLVSGADRWYFFWASVLAYAVVAGYVVTTFLKAPRIPEPLVAGKLRTLTAYLSVLWLIYPFVFALYFGGAINGTTEDICYMVLDVLAKVGFGFILLMGPAVELVDKVRNVAPPAEESERPLERGRSAGIAR
jgi:bacteriorhodopsin